MPIPGRPTSEPTQNAFTVRHEDCWAKTTEDGKPGISVLDHCLNVGCVARKIVAHLPNTLRKALALDFAPVLAAAHDVGKVTPGFQAKCPVWLLAHPISHAGCTDHAKISQYAVQEYLTPDRDNLWAAAIGAHHGSLKGAGLHGLKKPAETSGDWVEQRAMLLNALERTFGLLPHEKATESNALVIAGLVAVADWIGSDETFFPPGCALTPTERAETCEGAVAKLGLGPAVFRPGLSFSDLFPKLDCPTELQRKAVEAITKPGVYVIEGPMGCGKTEAALAAAYSLIASGQATGIYFALPTQTTSNRIHLRIEPFVKAATSSAIQLRLAHSTSWLHDKQFISMRSSSSETAQDATAARTWFASSKRALLTQIGVGTVDQALLGIVAAKHFFVRQFALAGKVVILDEIHTYDLYTSTLIDALIKRLLEVQCTVIVLSATLIKARRKTLLCSQSTSNAYPLLSGKTADGSVIEVPVEATSLREVGVQFLDSDLLVERGLTAAQRGACVLWIRNTVQEAQETYLRLATSNRQGGPEIALLHARFPFFRREELENDWMARLGKEIAKRPAKGCILVSTQVVEQSVDIDADLLITDLAPTDMLFQRMGRLWRHERGQRPSCERPEVWIRDVGLSSRLRNAAADEMKAALGKSARVYAPYVLVRSLNEWSSLRSISLPGNIRQVLERTYALMHHEPVAWTELHEEMRGHMDRQKAHASAATGVWNLPALADEEGVQTRYSSLKTANLVLARQMDADGNTTRVNLLDGTHRVIRGPQFDFSLAKALHRNLVRVPAWCVREATAACPAWVKEYVPTPCAIGTLGAVESGKFSIVFPVKSHSGLYYRDDLGIVIDRKLDSPAMSFPGEELEDESYD